MKYAEVVKAVNEVIEQYTVRLTVRQIYYRLVSPPYQLFPNRIQSYKGLDRILTSAREKGDINWRKIEDRARRTSGGDRGYEDPESYVDALSNTLSERYYSRRMWDAQPQLVEVWVEKDALASLFEQALDGLRIVLFPTRGYSSLTGVMEAIEDRFRYVGKPVKILHFTDHDPSGLNMTEDLDQRFGDYGASRLTIERVMLTIDQVRQYELAPNPTKRADSRTQGYVTEYGDECWELDAVDPAELQKLVTGFVHEEIDWDTWNKVVEKVEEEKKAIKNAIEEEQGEIDELIERIKEHLRP